MSCRSENRSAYLENELSFAATAACLSWSSISLASKLRSQRLSHWVLLTPPATPFSQRFELEGRDTYDRLFRYQPLCCPDRFAPLRCCESVDCVERETTGHDIVIASEHFQQMSMQ